MSHRFNGVASREDPKTWEDTEGRTEPETGQTHARASEIEHGMDMTTPGVKAFAAARLVAKTKRSLDIRFFNPGDIPMRGKLTGLRVVIAAKAQNG